jgi:hypothetical protein
MPAKCEYEVTLMNRRLVKPAFVQQCSLTGHACLCLDDYRQCVRRTYALDYELKRQNRAVVPLE